SALTEVKYPGGSITMKEIERLEASVEENPPPRVETGPTDSLSLPYADPKLAVTQGRIDVERELFRLSWRALGHSKVTDWHTSRHIDELERADVIAPRFAQNLRSFIDVANRVIHGTQIPDEVVARTASIAGELLSTLRYKRLVYEAQHDFEGHGLWHMRDRLSDEDEKHYLMSAVASQLPEFAYDYDVYRDAVGLFNARQRSDNPAAPGGELYVLSLPEFVQSLEWREKELERLRDELPGTKWDEYNEVNRWKWPSEWGDLHWSTSILRDRVSIFNAEQDLMQTRSALDRHRSRLLADKRRGSRGGRACLFAI
ncbi:MAG: hypothetical protein ACE5JO_11805, partial [Candidatus Binatia bacterium]